MRFVYRGLLGSLFMILLVGCSSSPKPKFDRSTLEFRLVQSGSTRLLNGGDFRRDIRRLRSMYATGRADEDRVREILETVQNRSGVRGGKVFLQWQRTLQGDFIPRSFVALGPPKLDCHDISRVDLNYAPRFSEHEILVKFNQPGARKIHTVSKVNLGRRLAIVWRGRVIVIPSIHTAIPDGQAVISGSMSRREASEITRVIKGCLTNT